MMGRNKLLFAFCLAVSSPCVLVADAAAQQGPSHTGATGSRPTGSVVLRGGLALSAWTLSLVEQHPRDYTYDEGIQNVTNLADWTRTEHSLKGSGGAFEGLLGYRLSSRVLLGIEGSVGLVLLDNRKTLSTSRVGLEGNWYLSDGSPFFLCWGFGQAVGGFMEEDGWTKRMSGWTGNVGAGVDVHLTESVIVNANLRWNGSHLRDSARYHVWTMTMMGPSLALTLGF